MSILGKIFWLFLSDPEWLEGTGVFLDCLVSRIIDTFSLVHHFLPLVR